MEELSECMLKLEKIKMVINRFQKTLCPKCGEKLNETDNEYPRTFGKIRYKCGGCFYIFHENQFYETYWDEIELVMKE